jgi:hypothetical protein
MNLLKHHSNLPATWAALEPGPPLWQIVPTHGADGRPLADFMMLIPGLRRQPQHVITTTLSNLQAVLEQYREVVFVNLDLKINVLWVSVNCRPGIILELVAAIQRRVPEALLVAQKPDY